MKGYRRASAVIIGMVFLLAGILKLMDPVGTGLIYALVGLAGLVSIPILMKPLSDDEDVTVSQTRVNNRPNYNMEAGKEEDFSDVKQKNKDYNNRK